MSDLKTAIDIKAEIDEFIDTWCYEPADGVGGSHENLHALINAVVEECCTVTDKYHADGLTEEIQRHMKEVLK